MKAPKKIESAAERPALLWFRDDLRLADHAALRAAAKRPVVACYVLDTGGTHAPGAASRWWLHGSLTELAEELQALGGALILRRGAPEVVVPSLAAETNAAEVHCSKSFEPEGRRAEDAVRGALGQRGTELVLHAGALLFDPEVLRTQAGEPFRVFTPFWNACLRADPPAAPLPAPTKIRFAPNGAASDALEDWALLPTDPDWAGGLRETWSPGERAARARLRAFAARAISTYRDDRDRPDRAATSRLSASLHFGELSVRSAWHATRGVGESSSDASRAAFLRELAWREFARHLLWHWPELASEPLRREFRRFPWRDDAQQLSSWQRGRTGYPIVDAGMRELWHTGWMHNRVRMVAASFLVKHLLIPWQTGAAWFWDTLVDADLANNSVSWQWVAGCGADAAPYFRIFNPTLQGREVRPRRATTCGVGFRSSRNCLRARSTSRARLPRQSCGGPGSSST